MNNYQFRAFFNGTPDNGTAGLNVTAPRDTVGASPPFVGDIVETLNGNVITLTALRLSSFSGIDEVADLSAGADGNLDYIGGFQLTVQPVPEPASGLRSVLPSGGCWCGGARSADAA
jgi:hypothetical protein